MSRFPAQETSGALLTFEESLRVGVTSTFHFRSLAITYIRKKCSETYKDKCAMVMVSDTTW